MKERFLTDTRDFAAIVRNNKYFKVAVLNKTGYYYYKISK